MTLKIHQGKSVKSMISSTADGASLNFSKYTGILTQQKENRLWFITIHCVSHRAKLLLNGSLLQLNDLVASKFYLHKRLGKLKKIFRNIPSPLNIDGYIFSRATGSRFVTCC